MRSDDDSVLFRHPDVVEELFIGAGVTSSVAYCLQMLAFAVKVGYNKCKGV